MKKRITTISIFICLSSFLFGQDFVTKLYFEDAKKHKDTVVIGYDPNASDLLDESFGETNINSLPFDSVFDVRISDAYLLMQNGSTSQFLTKKQIFQKKCDGVGFPTPAILIKCKYYPIVVKWDKGAFNDSCRSFSFITLSHPGGWFDALSGPLYYMKSLDSVKFSSFTKKYTYTFNNLDVDTVRLLFFCIASHKNLSVNTPVINQLPFLIYPNPVDEKIFLQALNTEEIEQITIMDINGKIFTVPTSNIIDVSYLKPGMYIFSIKFKYNKTIYKRLLIK